MQNLSSDPANTVIGLVRDLKATEAKVAELHRDNVHIFKADLDDYDSLKVLRFEDFVQLDFTD